LGTILADFGYNNHRYGYVANACLCLLMFASTNTNRHENILTGSLGHISKSLAEQLIAGGAYRYSYQQ
jgi:hypothetical protein